MKKFLAVFLSLVMILPQFTLTAFASDEVTIYIDGQKMNFSQGAIVKNDRVLVPMREIFEKLNANIVYDESTQTVTGTKNSKSVTVTIDSSTAYVDGQETQLDVNACLVNDKTMIPLRFISQSLGASVDWSEDSKSVYIFSDAEKLEEPKLPEIKKNEENFSSTHQGDIIACDEDLFKAPYGDNNGNMTCKTVDVEDMPFNKALEIEVKKQPKNTYDMSFTMKPNFDVQTGDILYLTCYMRTLSSSADENSGTIAWVYEQNTEPFKKAFTYECTSVGKWQKYSIGYAFKLDNGSKDSVKVVLRVGYKPQVVQVAGFELINYKDTVELKDIPKTTFDYYEGMEPDAQWRKEAENRIEQIRKGDYSITVVDENDKIIPNAKVSVDMVKHEFDLGTVVWGAPSAASDMKFFDTIKQNFNMVVPGNALKWKQFESNKQAALDVVKWANDNGLKVRGHALIWDSLAHMPSDLKQIEKDKEKALERTGTHIYDEVSAFKDRIYDWDVVNEAVMNLNFRTKYGEQIYVDWFKKAREADPNANLYINETGIVGYDSIRFDSFMDILKKMKEYNVDYDAIGIQGHFSVPCNPMDFYNQLETISSYAGKPIKITEYSMNSDEIMQAYFTKDILTAVFSNKNVNGFVMWGHYEGADGTSKSTPMYRSDWTLKPAGEQFIYLTQKKWSTHQKGSSGSDGLFYGRGFYGDYDVTTEYNGKKQVDRIHIGKGDINNFKITLGKPSAPIINSADISKLAPKGEPLPDGAWEVVKTYDFDNIKSGEEASSGCFAGSNLKIGTNILTDSKTSVKGNSLLIKNWANYCKCIITNAFDGLDTAFSSVYKISYDATVNPESDLEEFETYPYIAIFTQNSNKTNIEAIYNSKGLEEGSCKTLKKGEWTHVELIYHIGDVIPQAVGFVAPLKTTDKEKAFINIDNLTISKLSDKYLNN
ncbi:MAG: endo-1,4-beta-xylanase [Oscillospiraceae bacterium]|nr:endo-1,4-beta-xylanase [Oscillospiraceae bacterium]